MSFAELVYDASGENILLFIWWLIIHMIAAWVAATGVISQHLREKGMHHCIWEIFLLWIPILMAVRGGHILLMFVKMRY